MAEDPGEEPPVTRAVVIAFCRRCLRGTLSVPCPSCDGPACADCGRCPPCDGPIETVTP